MLQTATCCALCNDSTLTYNTGELHGTGVTLLLVCAVVQGLGLMVALPVYSP